MFQILRQTLRSLLRHRGFTAVVLLTLALGIGATTAIFSVVRHVLLRPLPYPDADRLARIWVRFPEINTDRFAAAHQEYLDYRHGSELMEEVGAYAYRTAVLTEAGEPLPCASRSRPRPRRCGTSWASRPRSGAPTATVKTCPVTSGWRS